MLTARLHDLCGAAQTKASLIISHHLTSSDMQIMQSVFLDLSRLVLSDTIIAWARAA